MIELRPNEVVTPLHFDSTVTPLTAPKSIVEPKVAQIAFLLHYPLQCPIHAHNDDS